MDQILDQLGGLLLGSLPTVVLFLLLVIVYWLLVYKPLTAVLADRHAQGEGAMEQAHAAIALAEAKAEEYEAQLRAARRAIFHARQERLASWNHAREAALADAQETARKRVDEAKLALELESEQARQSIDKSAGDLAQSVLRAVLPQEMAVSGSTR